MTIRDELLAIFNQIPAAIEKAFTEALVLRHPGHGNQKTHGNRYGSTGAAKESLRRLRDDKAAREKYKQSARQKAQKQGVFGASQDDYSQDYRRARQELNQARKAMGGTPESQWSDLDKEFMADARSKVQEELELSKVAKAAGYSPGNMTAQEWGTLASTLKQEANDDLRHAFETGRQSAGEKLRGKKDIWMQVGGEAKLSRSGKRKQEAKELVSRLNRENKRAADEYMSKNLEKLGYSSKTVQGLDYNQKRRLMAEVGHGQLQSGSIGGVPISERRRVVSAVSEYDRLNARSTAMNPRAGKGMERWTYYEQASLKAGKRPDLIPDYLMDIQELPDYVRFPGGKNPYRQKVEEIDF